MFTHGPHARDELSPQRIALLILVDHYYLNDRKLRRRVHLPLAQLLEGSPQLIQHTEANNPSHTQLFELLQEAHTFAGSDNPRVLKELNAAKQHVSDILRGIKTPEDTQGLVKRIFTKFESTSRLQQKKGFNLSLRSLIGRFIENTTVAVNILDFDDNATMFASLCEYRDFLFKCLNSKATQSNQGLSNLASQKSRLSSEDTSGTHTKSVLQISNSTFSNKDLALFAFLRSQDAASTHSAQSHLVRVSPGDMDALFTSQMKHLESFGTAVPTQTRFGFRSMMQLVLHASRAQECGHESSLQYVEYLLSIQKGNYHRAFDALHRYFDYMVSKGSRHFYHFALISKATLHCIFDENQKALDAIEEAISVARENRDNSTLAFILSWLFDFMRQKPAFWNSHPIYQMRDGLRLLDIMIKKSSNISLLLAAVCYRFETEHLMNGYGTFTKWYESSFKALFMSLHDDINSFAGSCETASKVWSTLGVQHLYDAYSDLKTSCLQSNASINFSRNDNHMDGEYTSSRSLERHFYNKTSEQFLGRDESLLLLLSQIDRHIQAGEIAVADQKLTSVSRDIQMSEGNFHEYIRLLASLRSTQSDFYGAVCELEDRCRSISQSDQKHKLMFALLKSEVLINSGLPHEALSHILQQIQMSVRLGLQAFSIQALMPLMRALNYVGSFTESRELGVVMLPLISISHDKRNLAACFNELADSLHRLQSSELSTKNDFDGPDSLYFLKLGGSYANS